MASGILAGGSLPQSTNVNPYTTPAGKVTTATLVLVNGGAQGSCFIQLAQASFAVTIPASGVYTMAGVILGSGQGLSITSYAQSLSYMLTGWEVTP